MIQFSILIPSKPKPAGSLGKHGNITMNKNGYIPWKRILARHIEIQAKEQKLVLPVVPYGIVIHHRVVDFKCGDLLNINGAVIDAIKLAGVIKDDSPCNLNRFTGSMTRSPYNEITIVICDNYVEYQKAQDLISD